MFDTWKMNVDEALDLYVSNFIFEEGNAPQRSFGEAFSSSPLTALETAPLVEDKFENHVS
jgi:hypothetical protein